MSRAGFTLVETIIALLLSTAVVILVSTTFLVQNRYYAEQVQQTGVHDNARSATELMAAEIRSVMADGVVVAGARTLTIRTPITMAVVCNRQANFADVYTFGGEDAIDTLDVGGVALRDEVTGAWTYGNATWNTINGAGGNPAPDCFANGADTVGARNQFHRLKGLAPITGLPDEGDVLMIFRETTFSIGTSAMDSTVLGLFRTRYSGSPEEYATGLDTTAQFQYRTGGSSYSDTVTSANLADIDVVRVIADARKPAPTGGVDDVTFGWSVNIALRNVRESS